MRITAFLMTAVQSAIGAPNERVAEPKKGQVDFYLVRHGETIWNEKKEIVNPYGEKVMGPLIQGSSDIELNAKGEKQAEEAAERFAVLQLNIGAIYTSPLKRAAKTAQAIASRIGLTSIEEPAFAACSWGVCEGRTKEYRKEKYFFDFNKNYRGPGWENLSTRERWSLQPVEGAESMSSVIERMKSAFARIAADSGPGSSICVVTHDENMKAFILHCEEEKIEKARLDGDIDTVIRLEKRDIGNCTIHQFTYDLGTAQFRYGGEISN